MLFPFPSCIAASMAVKMLTKSWESEYFHGLNFAFQQD